MTRTTKRKKWTFKRKMFLISKPYKIPTCASFFLGHYGTRVSDVIVQAQKSPRSMVESLFCFTPLIVAFKFMCVCVSYP